LAGLAVVPAFAGTRATQYVFIQNNNAGFFVYGAVGDARASADGRQGIWCATQSFDGGAYLVCTATDSGGRTVACFTRSASMIQAAQSIGPNSYVHFRSPNNSDCDGVTVENGSRYRPATP
jgi:hypothetical protein